MMNKRRTKTCIIHKVRTPDGRSFYKEARSLASAGYEVCLIGLFGDGERVMDGVRMLGFSPGRGRLGRFVLTNARIFLRAVREKAEIVHFHDPDFIPWAILLKVFTGGRVIYDIHEAYPEYMMLKSYIPKLLRPLACALVYLLEHSAARLFDAIVPNDNYIAKGFSHRNNVTIFNFPTLDFFDKAEEVPWQEREYDLFYHGSLPAYNFEAMMEIAQRLNARSQRNLWGIVPNDPGALRAAREAVSLRGLQANFVFLPPTGYLHVSKYLRQARIGIIPLPAFRKFMKNIPLKMFEFMGCGLPVVLSDLPPSRQFIRGEGCAVAVEAGDTEAFAGAIAALLRDPAGAAAMGGRGRGLVLSRCNWGKEEEKLLWLYSGLTGGLAADAAAGAARG